MGMLDILIDFQGHFLGEAPNLTLFGLVKYTFGVSGFLAGREDRKPCMPSMTTVPPRKITRPKLIF